MVFTFFLGGALKFAISAKREYSEEELVGGLEGSGGKDIGRSVGDERRGRQVDGIRRDSTMALQDTQGPTSTFWSTFLQRRATTRRIRTGVQDNG